MITKSLLKSIKKKIAEHHALYPDIPLNNVHWESRLKDAFEECGHSVEWNANGHGPGKDLVVDGIGISCKGGKVTKRGLTISSHRLTRFKSLSEKINYISEKHEDLVYSLAKVGDKYKLSVFETPDFGSLSWTPMNSGYGAEDKNVTASIRTSMSDQLWYTIRNVEKVYDL